jgi:hypothetical protein
LLSQALTISSLVVTAENIKWYDASSGGTEYTETVNPALINGQTYYVSETISFTDSKTHFEINVNIS